MGSLLRRIPSSIILLLPTACIFLLPVIINRLTVCVLVLCDVVLAQSVQDVRGDGRQNVAVFGLRGEIQRQREILRVKASLQHTLVLARSHDIQELETHASAPHREIHSVVVELDGGVVEVGGLLEKGRSEREIRSTTREQQAVQSLSNCIVI